jgi:hypothetical protein
VKYAAGITAVTALYDLLPTGWLFLHWWQNLIYPHGGCC